MRFHRPKRRQSASTSTWPPCAVAWSELVRRRGRVDFCFVNNGMDTHHHKGDVAASTISPAIAFLFTRLRIGAIKVSAPAGSRIPIAHKAGAVGIWPVARRSGAALGRYPTANIGLFSVAPVLRIGTALRR